MADTARVKVPPLDTYKESEEPKDEPSCTAGATERDEIRRLACSEISLSKSRTGWNVFVEDCHRYRYTAPLVPLVVKHRGHPTAKKSWDIAIDVPYRGILWQSGPQLGNDASGTNT
jgi:hypothetical protein